ncbi:MAG: HlyC/CorC family transporter [Alistipes sp.]|nr:HlyC/CorC family transporter [Alistipes sp.]
MITSVVVIVVMLTLSAFFSGMEIAFINKNRLKLEIDRKQNRLFDYIADIFARHPGQYITTILVGNNIALVVYSLCMSVVIRALAYAFGWREVADNGSFVLETIVPTIIVIFVGEYIPKSIFRSKPNFYYKFFAPVIYLFYLLLYPLARFTTLLSYGILRLFGRKNEIGEVDMRFDRSDLEHLLDSNNNDTQHEPADQEIKILQNALDFADLRVRDCMISRVDIEAVDGEDTSIEELTERFVDSMYSRIFVWRGSIDNIVGYVNVKSLFHEPKSIEEVLMEVDFVAETLPLQQMLEHFMKSKSNIAVVIDEFGGTAGIISLEDVLEQIFGDIEDEHDKPEMVEKQVSENEYVFSCRLDVEYLNERYGLNIEESEEYDTLAGYIIYNYDGLPVAGEIITIDDLRIKILRTTRSRLELARVEMLQKK